MSDQDLTVITPEIEEQARSMGWVPQEDFKGAEAKWVDAQTFVDKGEHVLPIIKATNKRLRDDLTKLNTQLDGVTQALQQSQETIKALEKYHQDDVKQKVDKARTDLKRQLKEAKKEGDTDAEVDLTEELTRLNVADQAASDAEAAVTAKGKGGNGQDRAPPDYSKDPTFLQWKEDNPWFGTDQAKSAIAYMITTRLRASGNTETGRPFLDKVSADTAKELSRLAGGRPGGGKVESSKGGSTGSNGGRKSFADLPSEAKAACDGFNNTLVGKGRRYETVDAWRKAYAEQYFRDI